MSFIYSLILALLHKDLKCKAPLIEPNLRRNLGKW
ncbi:benzoate transporter, partial [Acinetobacter baumannii]